MPSSPNIQAGQISFDSSIANQLKVHQSSNNAIINWEGFSISQGELTQFLQPSSSSSVLNRVTGGNLLAIYGELKANGNVYLINPNGVLVGSSGIINVNSFIASTLDVSNDAFMANADLIFKGDSTAEVKNLGTINAEGGDVFLIARKVNNAGTINAPNGTVGLAAGEEVLLKKSGDQRLFVRVKKKKEVETEGAEDTENQEGGTENEDSTDQDLTTNDSRVENNRRVYKPNPVVPPRRTGRADFPHPALL